MSEVETRAQRNHHRADTVGQTKETPCQLQLDIQKTNEDKKKGTKQIIFICFVSFVTIPKGKINKIK